MTRKKTEAAPPTPTQKNNTSQTPPGESSFLHDIEKNAITASVTLSPIQYFPFELLAEIFMFCISDREIPPRINESKEPPVSLCSVCRSWKNVAYGLPGLWTSVCVDMKVIGSEERKMLPYLLERWLFRANPHPLDFHFYSEDYVHEYVSETLNTCIIPFAHRLRHLDICTPSADWRICEASFESPALQSAMMQNNPSYDKSLSTIQFTKLESAIILNTIDVRNNKDTHLFSYAPSLRRIRMDNSPFNGSTPVQNILPWSQLTHLILVNLLELHLWQRIFPMCLNLQHGLFDIYEDDPMETQATAQSVAFNHLIELTLTFNDPVDPSILSRFDFPALVTLRIGIYYDSMEAESIHTRFLQQLVPLRRLSLRGDWPFALILDAATHVVELDVHDTSEFEAFLLSLLRRPDGYLPASNLKVLIVDTTNCSGSEAFMLADIIKSRRYVDPERNGIERLVVIPGEGSYREESLDILMAELQTCVDDGFLLELEDATPCHWSGRLDYAETEWREGMFDIEERRR